MHSFKNTLIALTVIAGLAAAPAQGLAQSTTTEESSIADLQAQIDDLLEQVEALKEQLGETKKQAEDARERAQEAIEFSQTLRRGIENEQVRRLQEFLADNPDIYPQGLVTGYFGPLTERAVERFQQQNGLPPVGIVGPRTRSQLNRLLTEGAGRSGKVPPGLLRAPGIAKKLNLGDGTTTDDMDDDEDDEDEDEDEEDENEVTGTVEAVATSSVTVGGDVYTVTDDTEFSDGLEDIDDVSVGDTVKVKYEEDGDELIVTEIETEDEDDDESDEEEGEEDEEDSESDEDEDEETADVAIRNLNALVFGTDTAVVTWNTNVETTATLYYSTSTPEAGDENTTREHNSALSTHHGFLLSGLEDDTTYNYFGVSTDDDGTSATSSTRSFTTDS